jgi:cbb3-type cytochrome oxidase maturation protein
MDILYMLIPVSVVIVFAIGVVFWWAISSGQFDELDREGRSVVDDRDAEPK